MKTLNQRDLVFNLKIAILIAFKNIVDPEAWN